MFNTKHRFRLSHITLTFLATTFYLHSISIAQDGSLLRRPVETQSQEGLTMENSSFLYIKPLPPIGSELKKNTIITVLVDVRTRMLSEGDYQSRVTKNITAKLADWIKFDGKSIGPAGQRDGDPTISGSLKSQDRSQADMESRDSMTFRIAAKIVDIRPNGNLVIEAHQEIRNNEEIWQQSLTGVVARESIGRDRTVKSDNISELRITKREVGQVRDGYKRGWFQRFYDRAKPF